MPKALRSVLVVLGGFVLIGALAFPTGKLFQATWPSQFQANGTPSTTPMMLVQLLYVGLYATFGCWLTARLAPSRPMLHALVLGALGLVLNVSSALALRDTAPAWYWVAGVGTTVLWAWLGGRIAEAQGGGQRAAATA